ncbi:hypothetical protein BGZ83_005713 [Gryganskiella cystojenkinii]|nr:hypothetical protein BGZ83_005713 [Gryganskiella cystojenkinii]
MAVLIKLSLLAVLSILSLCTTTTAHSPAWPTIAYSETIQSVHHDIFPRTASAHHRTNSHNSNLLTKRGLSSTTSTPFNIIQRDDKVRLEFSAFNTTFYLHLEPNHDLIHPELDLSKYEDIGSINDIKAFKGIVVQDENTSIYKWNQDMTTSTINSNSRTLEHRLYEEGVLGWARMMIEHDSKDDTMVLRGAFTDGSTTYHVTSRQHYQVQKRYDDHSPSNAESEIVIYRDSDLVKPNKIIKRGVSEDNLSTCGSTGRSPYSSVEQEHGYYYPPDLTAPVPMGGAAGAFDMGSAIFRKRDDIMVKVAGPSPIPTGCPTTRMVNYMGVAADCTYVRSYGGLANARKQILADFNTASGIYESTFNVVLGINSLQIESMNCPILPIAGMAWNQECSDNYTINDRLSDFSYWRGQGGRNKDGNGLWHLLTGCNTGPILGIAWTKALCQANALSQGNQYTAGTGVSSISPNEWMVVAHEVGHGFGANHDCTSGTCVSAASIQAADCCPLSGSQCDAGDQYIMNPQEQTATRVFSPCSINSICSTLASSSGKCLQPPAAKITQSLNLNVCGNGIKEDGEQCDCGSPAECAKDPCCDGTTCKLKGTAVCDDLNDDCCHNCKLAPKGEVCRSAISDCDIAETCSGTSFSCPPDVQVPNLTSCTIVVVGAGNKTVVQGQGQCANGICTSRDLQCAQQQRPGITKQCSAMRSGCQMLCNDPSGATDTCMQIPGINFKDGSPCGNSGNGVCDNGDCILPGGWARNHLQVLIPVVCLGLIICVGGPGLGLFCHRRKVKKLSKDKDQQSQSPPPEPLGGKDTKELDVPRWMMTENRRSMAMTTSSSTPMSRRASASGILSRRNSLSAQNILGREDDSCSSGQGSSGQQGGIDLSNTSTSALTQQQQQQQLYFQYHQEQAQGQTQQTYPYTYMNQHRMEHEHNSPFLYQFESPPPTALQSPAPAYSPFGAGLVGRFPDLDYQKDEERRPGHPHSRR